MTEAGVARAIGIARTTIGVSAEAPARAVQVRRLDRDGAYVIVYLGQPNQPGWIAAVDLGTDDVMSWADNRSGASTLPEVPADADHAEYVWAPGVASRSPLYPLLLVSTGDVHQLRDLSGGSHPYPVRPTRG